MPNDSLKYLASFICILVYLSISPAYSANCPNSELPPQYRQLAIAAAESEPQALIKPGLPENGGMILNVVTKTEIENVRKTVDGPVRFAGFFMPASLFIDSRLILDAEANAASQDSPEDLSSAWGFLLVPTDIKDCRFLFLAPKELDAVLPVTDYRRQSISTDSASQLLDAVYRRALPNNTPAKNILEEGISDPTAKVQFAEVMGKPLVVYVDRGSLYNESLEHPPATKAPIFPPSFLWERSMWQFAWPESLRALYLKADEYWRIYRPLTQKRRNEWTSVTIKSDLKILHEIMISLKPAGELAAKDLVELKNLSENSNLARSIAANYGQQFAMLDREFGNQYTLLADSIENLYGQLYEASLGPRLLNQTEVFDEKKLLSNRPKAADDIWDFKTLKRQGFEKILKPDSLPGILGNAAAQVTAGGTTYLLFKDSPDPATNELRIQPELVVVLKMQPLLNLATGELNDKIPQGSCSVRYKVDPVKWTVDGGQLAGSANVEVQLWTCITHKWVCFKGWKPHWCKNQITTRLAKHHDVVSTAVRTTAMYQGVSMIVTPKVPYQSYEPIQINKSIAGVTGKWLSVPQLTLRNAYFTKLSGSDEIVWVLSAEMPPMEIGTAAATAEILKAYLDEETSK